MTVNGLAVVDKEAGWTSHDVVARCRRLFGQRRVGHAGTLDPDATGILLVGLGRATRLLRFLTALPKTYVTDIVLGTATSTLDASGEVTGTYDMSHVTDVDVRRAAAALTGEIEQVPPMVSAVKVGGRRLHELARQGVEVERPARTVTVWRFETEPVPGRAGVYRAEVECSSGTYVRVLAQDLGRALGGGAHVDRLRRTRIGSFDESEARTLDRLGPDDVLTPAQAMRDLEAVDRRRGVSRLGGDRTPARPGAARSGGRGSLGDRGRGGHAARRLRGDGLGPHPAGCRPRCGLSDDYPQGAMPGPGTAVTIGAYDGVHLGHRALLDDLTARANEAGLSTVVVTFDRHPASVVRPESAPQQLTSLEQKLELLAACGIDRTVVIPFDEARAEESAEDFVTEVLVDELSARLVVVGEDFHFGHGRRGNVELLRRLGAEHGFDVVGVGLTGDGGEAVSSTRIRGLVAAGEVEAAAELLGRPHQVPGTVVRGDGRGGPQLGFPTANVEVPDDIVLPADGVYAGLYRRPDGTTLRAAISVGRRPTFYDPGTAPVLVEAYLLHFDGDLYGEPARVSFTHRLREELRFESVDALIAQMRADVEATERVLASADLP